MLHSGAYFTIGVNLLSDTGKNVCTIGGGLYILNTSCMAIIVTVKLKFKSHAAPEYFIEKFSPFIQQLTCLKTVHITLLVPLFFFFVTESSAMRTPVTSS